MSGYLLLIPEYALLVAALIALFADRLPGRDRAAAMLGVLASAVAVFFTLMSGTAEPLFGGALVFDEVSVVVRVAVAALSGVYLLWLGARGIAAERSSEATALALFSATGAMLMAGARDLVTLYIAIELSAMPAYVLMGYRRDDDRGLEGALKYFLLSLTTSLVMLYGFSFLFGMTGTTLLDGMKLQGAGTLGAMATVFVFVGLFAKLSAAPFHYWAPDAYAGAPAVAVAFVSTVPKLAGTIVAVRLAQVLSPQIPQLPLVLAGAAVVSMLLGNLAAYPQRDIRRLMAYSGIAHTGYVLLAVSVSTVDGFAAAVLYTIAYAVPSMAVMMIAAEEGSAIEELAGLSNRRPWMSYALVLFLLSLVGIPPMVGFFGKLILFTSVFDAGFVVLTVLGVVMSVISAGYYLRLMREAFLGEGVRAATTPRSILSSVALLLLAVATVVAGVVASPLLTYLGVSF